MSKGNVRTVWTAVVIALALASPVFPDVNNELVDVAGVGSESIYLDCICYTTGDSMMLECKTQGNAEAGSGTMKLNFQPPYAPHDTVEEGTVVMLTLPILATKTLRGRAEWKDTSIPVKAVAPIEFNCATGYVDSWDYLTQPDVLWILIAGFAAVMAYRFFSGRVMDFQDALDEFRGKK